MAVKKTKRMRAPVYKADDSNVVNWAVDNGIVSSSVGDLMKSKSSWSVRVKPNAKKATSYFSRISNGIFNRKGRNERIPGHIEAFMARVGSPLELSDARKVSGDKKETVAKNLGMDKPADILNVHTEGEKAIKPSSNIDVLRQALNDGVSGSTDQTGDGQLAGAMQRIAITKINKQVEKSTDDTQDKTHETKQETKKPENAVVPDSTKTKPDDEATQPTTTPAVETPAGPPQATQTQPTYTAPSKPTQAPTSDGKCPEGMVPVVQTEATPVVPGVAEKPAADPNSTSVQPGTLGFQQEGPMRQVTTVEDIARNVNTNGAIRDPGQDVQNHEPYETDMRPEYAMAKASDIIPSTRKQLESDIRFDMFDHVKPGFGEGMDNKLFLMQEARDKKIVYAPGMHEPGQWIGPTAGVDVPPWQWQRVIPTEQLYRYQQEQQARVYAGDQLLLNNGHRSSNILGDDIGYPMPYSASELKRNKFSPFEPVIRTDMHWQHVKEPIGMKLNRKRMRLETDAQRYPRALDSHVAGQGGMHLPKRRALEVILP